MLRKLIVIQLFALFLTGCADKSVNNTTRDLDKIELSDVHIKDDFWDARIDNNYRVSFINMLNRYEEMGSRPNPKLMEAGAYILHLNPDTALQKRLDENFERLIEYYIPGGRVREWHRMLNGDLYGAGHFLEAAVAYYQATGREDILDAAKKVADNIHSEFGPGARQEISQHEEVKIGLLRLYEITRDDDYLEAAKFFLDERGHSHNGRELYGKYAQDHKPVIEQDEAVGHTVRASYLYTPLAHLATLTGDEQYIKASDRLWENAVHKKTYLVGHVGAYRDHESFGENYELPNLNCWNETCAAIGNVFWNYRMFELHRESKYIDMMEIILYNAVLPAVSIDGTEYFYQNPLKSQGGFERHTWYGPNCCPPNIARLIASLGKYIYARDEDEVYINLFVGSNLETGINDKTVKITQETSYPLDGTVKIMIDSPGKTEFSMNIRIPGWTGAGPMPGDLYSYLDDEPSVKEILLNGRPAEYTLHMGYAVIDRIWQPGDEIELNFEMPVRKVLSHEKAEENNGMIALQSGPLVYCAEGIDNDNNIFNLVISEDAELEIFENGSPDGTNQIKGWVKTLSRANGSKGIAENDHLLTAIPYYTWANRGPGEMTVWFASGKAKVVLLPVPSIASKSTVSSSCGTGSREDNYPGGNVPAIAKRFYPSSQAGDIGFEALYDQVEPVNSFDGSWTYLRLRPQTGNQAWVQYDFDKEYEISSSGVYWKDDKQYCSMPESWNLEYKKGNTWQPVEVISGYTVERDKFNTIEFKPVNTTALRMNISLGGKDYEKGELGPPDGNYLPENTTWYECGIIEWLVK
ncbi:MAG: glycoside hydrolase family 127 protein [Bacteroidota bacterium]